MMKLYYQYLRPIYWVLFFAGLGVSCEPSKSDNESGATDDVNSGSDEIDADDATTDNISDETQKSDTGSQPKSSGEVEKDEVEKTDDSDLEELDSGDDVETDTSKLTDAGTGGTGDPDSGEAAQDTDGSEPTLPAVDSVDENGPFATTQELKTGPKGTSGLFYPEELGKDGLRHPIFVWGCGGSTNPSFYSGLLTKIASHGFVVIAEVSAIGDNGKPLVKNIDWIVAENERAESKFFQKLDTYRIALGGHSMGSANAFFVAADPRLTTTIHVAGGSLDNVNNPYAPTTGKGGKGLIHPVAYICSQNDNFGNVEKTRKDYANTTVPAFFTIMTGTNHVGAPNAGLPVVIAWLRWHLAGETERRSSFVDEAGEFCSGIFVSESKNL